MPSVGISEAARGFELSIAHRPGDTAVAWLLAGWLAAQLRLERQHWPSIEESRFATEILTLTVNDGSSLVTAVLFTDRVVVTQQGAPPMIVPAPRQQLAESMAAELRALSRDMALSGALVALGQGIVRSS